MPTCFLFVSGSSRNVNRGLDADVGDKGDVHVVDAGGADEPGILRDDRAALPSLALVMNPSIVVCPDFFGDCAREGEYSLWEAWWSSSGDKFRDFF